VLNQRSIPCKSEYKRTDKNGENENKNFGQNVVHFLSVSEISEHFLLYLLIIFYFLVYY